MRALAVFAVAVLVTTLSAAAPVVPAENPVATQIAQLREEISLLNLINGLNLSREQVKQLRDYAAQSEALRDSYYDRGSATVNEALAAFRELRGVVAKNEAIPDKVENRAGTANERLKDLHTQYAADMRGLEHKADEVLTPAQHAVLDEFKPCLIPPKNLKDPVRAGQAGNRDRAAEMLTKLRGLPEPVYRAKIDKAAEERMAIYEEHHGKFSPEEREANIKRFKDVVERARKMNDAQFQVEKQALAEEIEPRDRFVDLMEELSKVSETKFDAPGKTAKFLLSPTAISIYDERLALTQSSSAAASVARR